MIDFGDRLVQNLDPVSIVNYGPNGVERRKSPKYSQVRPVLLIDTIIHRSLRHFVIMHT